MFVAKKGENDSSSNWNTSMKQRSLKAFWHVMIAEVYNGGNDGIGSVTGELVLPTRTDTSIPPALGSIVWLSWYRMHRWLHKSSYWALALGQLSNGHWTCDMEGHCIRLIGAARGTSSTSPVVGPPAPANRRVLVEPIRTTLQSCPCTEQQTAHPLCCAAWRI